MKTASALAAPARAAVLAFMLALTGCGAGGGGSGSSPDSPPPGTPALATPELTWPEPAPIPWGTALSAAQLNARSPVPGSYAYTPAAGSKPEVGSLSLGLVFTPQDATRYRPVSLTRTLRVDKARPALRWDTPATVLQGSGVTAAGLGTAPRALYGVAGSADPASFSLLDGRPLAQASTVPGSVVLRARFLPQDTAHYEAGWVHTLLSVTPAAGTAWVDFAAPRQTLQGFGGSAAWYYTPFDAARADALFGSTGDALGLSILRLRIAPATWDANIQAADTGAWSAEMGNAVAAQARGALVFASAWTPPASMKIPHPERSNPLWSGRLDPAAYADYARYLNAYLRYARSRGVSLYAVSPQNEPDWDPADYESCPWSADELRAWIARHGATAVAGTDTRLMAPESLNFSAGLTEALLADPAAAAQLGIIAGHLYGGAAQPVDPASARPVWMTEHFLDAVGKAGGGTSWATRIDDALALARQVHEGLTLGQYNAYVHWWLVNASDAQPTGLIDGANRPNHFGRALQHYARFVRPGMQRVDATALPVPGVRLAAFATPAGTRPARGVLVLINDNPQATALDLALAGRDFPAWTPYVTTEASRFERQATLAATAGRLRLTLPPKSLTTWVTGDTP